MDLICSRCGEPWEIYYVLHEEPEAFEKKGGLIIRCPLCPANLKDVSKDGRYRGLMAEVAADVLGDDVDAIASALEDFGL
jgi:hypothetical protein